MAETQADRSSGKPAGRAAALRAFLIAWVAGCHRRALAVTLACLAAAVAAGFYAAHHLGIDTDTAKMIAAEVPWRQAELDYDRAFPGGLNLVIVIDGPSAEAAGDAAAALAARLSARPELFSAVERPDALPFFRRNGLLYLSPEELAALADRLTEMQPLVGSLAADPTVRGLFETLGTALDGVADGHAELSQFEKPLGPVADAVAAAAAGKPQPLSWQALLSGRELGEAGRSFVLTRPVRDYGSLQPGAEARAAVREAAAALGLTAESGFRVRQTGSVALNDEEFSTVAEGAGVATLGAFLAVCALLYIALRSWRLIVAIQATLLVGLTLTTGFAALAVGTLNLISVAFAVLFVGIAVDFGIQYAVQYRGERHRRDDLAAALGNAAGNVGGALGLATLALIAGFLSFLPTDYRGVSELGLIASGGMLIALFLNLTLLPALLTLLRPPAERHAVGYAWAGPIDRFLIERRRGVLVAAGAAALAGLALLPALDFDFNPLNLKDPRTESVATLFDLMDDPRTSPNPLNVLTADAAAAEALATRLKALPEAGRVMTLGSFVPDGQAAKLAVIEDLAFIVEPSLAVAEAAQPAPAEQTLAAMRGALTKLRRAGAGLAADHPVSRLAEAVEAALAKGPEILPVLERNLMATFPRRIDDLRLALQAEAVNLDSLPPEIVDKWVAADGRHKVSVYPAGDGRSNDVLRQFVAAVRGVAPAATGTPVSIQEAGDTVVGAFATAGILALAAIALLLRLAVGGWLGVALVLAPLGLAALLTVITCVAIGLPINFANIITLPLLLGIGVAFDIYFVANWQKGIVGPLQSSTARAIVFSAATTVCAFGSLALSSHPGTADMGILLTISLFYALACTLLVLPAMLAAASAATTSSKKGLPA